MKQSTKRTSTKAGLAGGLAVILMWLGHYFVPEFMAEAPTGAEAALTAIIMWGVARLSRSPSKPVAL